MANGFYYRNGKKHEDIRIKRSGIYGNGFMSLPQAQRFAKIRREERLEGPKLVHEQMAAMDSFTYRNKKLHKAGLADLKYSERAK